LCVEPTPAKAVRQDAVKKGGHWGRQIWCVHRIELGDRDHRGW